MAHPKRGGSAIHPLWNSKKISGLIINIFQNTAKLAKMELEQNRILNGTENILGVFHLIKYTFSRHYEIREVSLYTGSMSTGRII